MLRDRTDEAGNQSFGFFRPDYSPRKAATYLHNVTTILADEGTVATSGMLDYTIADQPPTVHDLLLRRSDGTFQLVVWDERLKDQDQVTLHLGVTGTSISVYDPTAGTDPIRTVKNATSIDLLLSDHPIVIEISSAR